MGGLPDWLKLEILEPLRELYKDEVRVVAEILGVPKNATQDEIKKQYRFLAKEHHPDKTTDKDSEKKMAEINEAYEVLSDQNRKELYDKYFKPK